uniref:Interleukin 11 receptor subunit alpha n=1 Tax=Sander lucioperca TaxID=283035 RepID=A0A8D0AI60_SANLU
MPGLLSSPVCLTVICFLSWSLRPSRAQIRTDEVSGVQYGRLESNVTLACGKSQIRIPVAWHLNHSSVLPWHKVTSDGTLVLLHVDHSAQGNYSCYDNRGLLLHSVKLRLGHPPGLLSISCKVPNHTHVRCSWVDSVKTFLPAKYNASFRGTGQEWRPCVVDVARKHCDVDHPAFWQTIHILRISETNALGSETTSVRFRLHDLLKPDPPESVLVNELEGYPKRLIVSWNFPSSWPLHDAFPLMFQIRYRPQGSIYWSEVYAEESPVMIFDALAGYPHEVQLRARDEVNSDSQWSEWSPLLLVRPWEVSSTSESPELLLPDYIFPFNTKPETSTAKPPGGIIITVKLIKDHPEDEGNLGLAILLVLFSVVILTTILSLIFVVWMRQRRRDHVTKQELTSMVKMKSMPI